MNSTRSISRNEANLIKIIKEKSFKEEDELQNESQNTQRIIRLFKGVIENFLEEKKIIYARNERYTRMDEVKIEEEVSVELSMVHEESKK